MSPASLRFLQSALIIAILVIATSIRPSSMEDLADQPAAVGANQY